jgi:steroid delta-isomerase
VNREAALRWAEQWVADWNARDLEAVLRHFEDDVAFTSPRALAVAGVPTVRGKPALRAYWTKALAGTGTLRFALDRVMWDPATSELAIYYDRDVEGRRDRAAEVLAFGASGRVVRAEVYHGLLP